MVQMHVQQPITSIEQQLSAWQATSALLLWWRICAAKGKPSNKLPNHRLPSRL
jgi:hypothetical protein